MEWNDILQWFVGASCVSVLYRAFRLPHRPWAVMAINIGILIAIVALRQFRPDIAGLAPAGVWFVLVLLPGLLIVRARRSAMRQQYVAAAKSSRIASWLLPIAATHRQAQMYHALALADREGTAAAEAIFARMERTPGPAIQNAGLYLFLFRRQWPQLVDWIRANFDDNSLRRMPVFLAFALRGLGETGRVEEMLDTIDRLRPTVDAPAQRYGWDTCRLYGFAFSGQPARAESVLRGPLRILPPSNQQYWIGTAEIAAGLSEAARSRLNAIDVSSSAILRESIDWRLQHPLSPAVLSPKAIEILDRLDGERDQEERYSPRGRPGWRPRATFAMILINVAMFALEWLNGGTTDFGALYRLGALAPLDAGDNPYWRMLAANFLHFGSAHLVLNMLALLVLGPPVEAAIGAVAFLLIYLASGIGAFAAVWALQTWQIISPGLTVGASGAIMGLLGANIAIMTRGWVIERAKVAKRRLYGMLSIVALQVVFDFLTPQVSKAAHIAGLCAGFVLASLIPHQGSRKSRSGSTALRKGGPSESI
jgi:rhomboid protease GluP